MQWSSANTLDAMLDPPRGLFKTSGKTMQIGKTVQIEEVSHESNDVQPS